VARWSGQGDDLGEGRRQLVAASLKLTEARQHLGRRSARSRAPGASRNGASRRWRGVHLRKGLDELFDGHAGVANERTQEARVRLGVVRNG
jgi:hypothetical protein